MQIRTFFRWRYLTVKKSFLFAMNKRNRYRIIQNQSDKNEVYKISWMLYTKAGALKLFNRCLIKCEKDTKTQSSCRFRIANVWERKYGGIYLEICCQPSTRYPLLLSNYCPLLLFSFFGISTIVIILANKFLDF